MKSGKDGETQNFIATCAIARTQMVIVPECKCLVRSASLAVNSLIWRARESAKGLTQQEQPSSREPSTDNVSRSTVCGQLRGDRYWGSST